MADQLLDLTAFAPSSEPVLDLEQFAPPKPAPAKKPGILIPSVKRTAGQMVGAAGVALEDLGLKTRLPEIGEEIVQAHPAQIQKPSDILEKPGTFIGESISEMLPQLGAYAAGAWGGAKIGGRLGAFLGPKGAIAGAAGGALIGGLAPIFTQEYGEIRGTQKKEGAENIPKALLGATAATALERLGAEKLVGRIVKGGGMDLIKEGVSRPLHMLKQGAIGALVEGPGTEFPQTAIERLTGGAPLANEEAIADYIISAAKGAAGGGIVTGVLSGLARREQPPAPSEAPPETAPAVEAAPPETAPAVEAAPAGLAEPLGLAEFIRANRAPGAAGPLTAAEIKTARPDYEAYKQAFINEQFGVQPLTPEQRNQILIDQTPLEVPAPVVEPAPEAPTAFVQKTRIAEPVVLGEQPAPAPAAPIITAQEAELLRIAEKETGYAPDQIGVQESIQRQRGEGAARGQAVAASVGDRVLGAAEGQEGRAQSVATKVALLKRQRGELLTNREAKLVRDYEKAAPKVEAPVPGAKPKFRGRQFTPAQRRENFVDAYSTAVDSALADLVAGGITITPNKLKRAASLLKRSAEAAVAAENDAAGAAILDEEMGKALRGIIPKNEIETFRQKLADAAQAAMPETLMSKAAQNINIAEYEDGFYIERPSLDNIEKIDIIGGPYKTRKAAEKAAEKAAARADTAQHSRAAVDAAIIAKSDEIMNTLVGMIGTPKDLVVDITARLEGGAGMITFGEARDIMVLSLQAKDGASLASHEGFHYLYERMLTSIERRVVRQAFASGSRLHRMLVAKAEAYDSANGTDIASEIRAIPAEARTYGFEFWRRGELDAQGMIAKVFQKLARVMERVQNYIDGLGFTSYEDLFAMIRRGEYAKRDLSGIREFEREVMRSRAQREASEKAWYSALTEAVADIRKVAGKDGTIAPAQAKAWLTARQKEGRFKAAELEAVGLAEWLDLQPGKVSVDDIETFVREHGVQVEETILGQQMYRNAGDRNQTVNAYRNMLHEKYGDGFMNAGRATEEERAELRRLEEGRVGDTTEFSVYQLLGGENYRELLLRLPVKERAPTDAEVMRGQDITEDEWVLLSEHEKDRYRETQAYVSRVAPEGVGPFRSPHFPGHPNILAHVRFNERTDADGKRVLFLEELQSDWAQKGRKEGFKGTERRDAAQIERELTVATQERTRLIDEAAALPDSEMAQFKRIMARVDELREKEAALDTEWTAALAAQTGVTAAPFVTETKAWIALALKRMIRYAAENGFDRVAWTTGEQQAARYDLSKRIMNVAYSGTNFKAFDHDGNEVISQTGVRPEDLPDLIGKDAAEKLMAQKPQGTLRVLSGQDLKIGGEGMKAFYDRIVPQVANELLKKFGGGKVEATNKLLAQTGSVQPGFDITPALRGEAMTGLPLFSRAAKLPQTETSEFKAWFGDSKVVDAQGKPLVVYHGTTTWEDATGRQIGDIQAFDRLASTRIVGRRPSIDTVGSWFSTNPGARGAEMYAGGGVGAIYPVYLSIKNPHETTFHLLQRRARLLGNGVDDGRVPTAADVDAFRTWLRTMDKDGVRVVHDTARDAESTEFAQQDAWIALEPTQIKSAIGNRGTFDPNDPNILYSKAATESIQDLGRRIADGDLQREQVNMHLAAQLDRPDMRDMTERLAERTGFELSAIANSIRRGYHAFIGSGENRARASAGYRNVFNVMTHYMQRKSLIFERAIAKDLSTWVKGASRQDKVAVSKAMLTATVGSYSHDMPEYQALRNSLTTEQRAMMDQAWGMIGKMLDAEFEADARKYRKLFADDVKFEEWFANRKAQVDQLKKQSYFPERRYGDHFVHAYVEAPDGKKITMYYEQYEREAGATSSKAELEKIFGAEGLKIEYGFKHKAEYDGSLSIGQFLDLAQRHGISLTQPEKERLGKALIAADSTRRNRVFRRQNVAGYSQDGMRVLAEFAVSMANKVAYSEMGDALQDALQGKQVDVAFTREGTVSINTQEGTNVWEQDGPDAGFFRNLADEKVGFVMSPESRSTVSNKLRAMATVYFLGGSVAAAGINLSSLPMITLPWLTQHTNAVNALAKLLDGMRVAGKHFKEIRDLPTLLGSTPLDGVDEVDGLRHALQIAAQDGSLFDTEIYQFMGLSRGQEYSLSGRTQEAVKLWMTPFRIAEQYNRVSAFIAAYKVAKGNNLANEAAFTQAQEAVYGTQFRYDEANRPALADSGVGSLFFVFKSFPIFMMETMTFLAKESPRSAVFMLGMLVLMAGVEGLPFAEDLEDLIDVIAQRLFGEPFNSKRWLRNTLKSASEAVVGADLSGVLMHGAANSLTGLNFASRVGAGNLVPGTRIGAADTDYRRAMEEILGPVGGMVSGIVAGGDALSKGDFMTAAKKGLPLAAKNAVKGWEQFEKGYATDAGGRKLVDVGSWEALWQSVGFSSSALAQTYESDSIDRRTSAFYTEIKGQFTKEMVKAIGEGDWAAANEIGMAVIAWNQAHPDMPIAMSPASIRRQVALAGMPLNQRTLLTMPRYLRGQSEAAIGLAAE